jgi:branched-chain amino acid transport system ATP-binding protein
MSAASQQRALAAEAVSVRFGGVQVLDSVRIAVPAGHITGLIGPNGAGKTTLINVLSGFQQASGTVTLNGRPVQGGKPHLFARRGIARTFQGGRLFGKMSVFENVFVAALGSESSGARAKERAHALLAHFGLQHRASEYARQIPYGEERLLSIARSLARQPAYLLLDEPAAGLNEAETLALASSLRGIPRQFGCGVLIVEHNMDLIMSSCSRIWVLARGRNLTEGTPESVRQDERVVAEYLGGAHAAA